MEKANLRKALVNRPLMVVDLNVNMDIAQFVRHV